MSHYLHLGGLGPLNRLVWPLAIGIYLVLLLCVCFVEVEHAF